MSIAALAAKRVALSPGEYATGWRFPAAVWRVLAMLIASASIALAMGGAVQAAEGDFLAIPKLQKRVIDQTATLSAADEGRIEARLKAFEVAKGAQIAVLIVATTQPETIFDYSVRVADAWKLGRKDVDDGVLFVVAKTDRKLEILTGRGTQGVLTDAVSKRIISEVVAPKFRSSDFAGGIDAGVAKIIDVLQGEALPPPPEKKRVSVSKGSSFESFLILGVIAAVFVGPLLRSLMGRFLGASATAGVTGAAAWWLAGGMLFPIIAGVIVFFIVLFMGAMNFSGGGGFSSGGWTGGGGSSGGSSDSFSGGGGGFDGGGASGDW